MKKKYLILLFFIIGLIILWSLLLLDSFKGNNDGIIFGIQLAFYAKYISIFGGLYIFWYAFFQKKSWLQNILIFILMLILTLAGLEWIVSIMLKKQDAIIKQNVEKGFSQEANQASVLDENLGFKPAPDTTLTVKKIKDGHIVYHVTYKTDSNNLRVTPTDSSIKRIKYAQFHGCSFTFGAGLEDNETTSYYFQKANPEYHAYNFAYSGYGSHQMLARFQSGQVKKLVKEQSGIAFFIYINDHVRRLIGGTSSYTRVDGNAPYFKQEGNKIVRHKLFKDGRIFANFCYKIMTHSYICRFFGIGYPFKLSENDYELAANIIAESAKAYEQQFENDNFYVIIYPDNGANNSLIIKYLKMKNIKTLDYSNIINTSQPKYAIKDDGHPTALANQLLIQQLQKDIKILH